MTDRDARTILLVDWPSRDVPDSLARAGWSVTSQEGPDTYAAYEVVGDDVERRIVDQPADVDAVYIYRPLDELSELVEFAEQLGARTIWWETSPDSTSPQADARAREMVEGSGLEFHAGRPLGSAS